MNISEPFIRRPVATTLLTIAIALGGAVAYSLLPVSPLPQVDFPTINVQATLPGASPETMASSVATPLETAVRPHRRDHRDDLHQHAGRDQHHAAIRTEPRHRRRGARRGSGHQRRARISARQSAEQSELSQGQSGRAADFPARADFGRAGSRPDVRCRLHHHRAEALADQRRGTGERAGRRAAGRARGAESDGAEQVRHRPGTRAQRLERVQRQRPQRAFLRRLPSLGGRRQRSDVQGQGLPAAAGGLQQRRAGAPVRRRRRDRFGGRCSQHGVSRTASLR